MKYYIGEESQRVAENLKTWMARLLLQNAESEEDGHDGASAVTKTVSVLNAKCSSLESYYRNMHLILFLHNFFILLLAPRPCKLRAGSKTAVHPRLHISFRL